MTPIDLSNELSAILRHQLMDPVLIIGGAGIGKSSIVKQAAQLFDLPVHDVRWGQQLLSDLRLPVPDHERRLATSYMTDLLPTTGPGILFLDEYNMATPAMMQIGQQLFLDRRYGSYKVPDGTFIWVAGNLKVHGAAVNEIPAPVNNRCIHFDVDPDLFSWRVWALANDVSPSIVGFVEWRPELLHKFDRNARAWPSPRSWEMADRRLKVGLSLAPAVGEAVADEFAAYVELLSVLPDVAAIAAGRGKSVALPSEPSQCYALVAELSARAVKSVDAFINAAVWFSGCKDAAEWTATYIQGTMRVLRAMGGKDFMAYVKKLQTVPQLKNIVASLGAAQ